ncbi:hypothetical protein E1298_44070 [Actinomadura rubrisoli]|uniref:Secreted protein n=1 Tax=Actinomadura rubrisoli TaxID=2530368 RepID=A0A4R5A0Y8_9ACTN|nr:hypothetical protein E1298_44070 [Actinomadura rubrisoli]
MTTLTVTAAGLAAVGAPAASAAPLDLSNFTLQVADNAGYLKSNVAGLDTALPNVGVGDIMAEANRKGTVTNGAACNSAAVTDPDRPDDKPKVSVTKSFCWQNDPNGEDDRNTKNWYPQGVTTVADAQADQVWGGSNQPLLVSWYFKGGVGNTAKGTRVSFIDPNTGSYRHVLLAHPFHNSAGNASYTSLRNNQTAGEGSSLHAGGMVWYGNFLYVADTARGFRVFDMRHIYDLKAAGDKGNVTDQDKVGRNDGVFYGYGYRYVMPEVTQWEHTASTGPADSECTQNDGAPNFSFASLDRSGTDHLVSGEYCDGALPTNGRVAAWKIGDATVDGEQRTAGSRMYADAAYSLPRSNIQGATRFNGRWYLSQSHGEPVAGQDDLGELHTTSAVTSPTGTLQVAKTQPAAIGCEDLSHWPAGSEDSPTLGTIWSVSEHPDRRMVYATLPQ